MYEILTSVLTGTDAYYLIRCVLLQLYTPLVTDLKLQAVMEKDITDSVLHFQVQGKHYMEILECLNDEYKGHLIDLHKGTVGNIEIMFPKLRLQEYFKKRFDKRSCSASESNEDERKPTIKKIKN